MSRPCYRARRYDNVRAEIGYGEKVSQRLRWKKLEEGIGLTARHRDAERPEGSRVFELERVVSCRNADPSGEDEWGPLCSAEPFDDLHRSTAFRAAPKDREGLRWKRRVGRLAAVVPNPTTESKAVGAWRVCGWPGSRSYGCAEAFGKNVQ